MSKTYDVHKNDGTVEPVTNADSYREDLASGELVFSDAGGGEVARFNDWGDVEEHDDAAPAAAPATGGEIASPGYVVEKGPESFVPAADPAANPVATGDPNSTALSQDPQPVQDKQAAAADRAPADTAPAAPADGTTSTTAEPLPGAGQGQVGAKNAPDSPAFDPDTQGGGYDPNPSPASPDLIPGTPAGDSNVYGTAPDPNAAVPDYQAQAEALKASQTPAAGEAAPSSLPADNASPAAGA